MAAVGDARVGDVLARGEAFLRSALQPGRCADFRTPVGESDEWVPAYVAARVADAPLNQQALAQVARFLLGRQRRSGGWGYNYLSPPDADSTAAVLRFLASRADVPAAPLRRAVRFLERHIAPGDGGISTYRNTFGLRLLMRAWTQSFAGWKAPHACVTAAAARALSMTPSFDRLDGVRDYLLRSQGEDGLWEGYWWNDPLYATAEALAFLRSRHAEGLLRVDPAPAIGKRQGEDGSWSTPDGLEPSAFSTALAVLSLRTGEPARRGVAWLMGSQRGDGSWSSVPIMRIPHPFEMHPGTHGRWRIDQLGTGVLIRDQHRRFTTATVVGCLNELARDGLQ